MENSFPAYVTGVGVDVSKDKLDLAIRLSNKNYVESSFPNNSGGIKQVCVFLKKQEATDAAPIVIESTGDYHLQSAIMIKQSAFNVKLINPITTKRYQKSSIRNAKTDKIDAKRLADMATLEQDLPNFEADVDMVKARKMISLLAHLEKSKQQESLRLKRFEETAKTLGIKYSLVHFKKSLVFLEKQIKHLKLSLNELTPSQIKQQAKEIKGVSYEKLAIIYALTNGKHFDNHDQLVAFFGLDVSVRKSGHWVGKAKLSKRGNSYARKTLYQMAWGLKMHNEIFKACYEKYREANYHYTTILMILARKFLRLYFSCNFKKQNSF